MLDYIETIWNLLHANYSYFQREKSPDELAGLLDIWRQLLADISPQVLRAAALQHIASSRWFPSVAELREQALEIMYPGRLSGVEAWGIVKAEVCRIGSWGKPHFEDEFIAASVKTIGWRTICVGDFEASNRKRFIDCYDALVGRAEKEAALLPVVREMIGQVGQKLLVGRAEMEQNDDR